MEKYKCGYMDWIFGGSWLFKDYVSSAFFLAKLGKNKQENWSLNMDARTVCGILCFKS